MNSLLLALSLTSGVWTAPSAVGPDGTSTVPNNAPKYTATAASGADAFVASQGAYLRLGTSTFYFDGTNLTTQSGTATQCVQTSATAGTYAFTVTANGAKIGYGVGADNYLWMNGTYATFGASGTGNVRAAFSTPNTVAIALDGDSASNYIKHGGSGGNVIDLALDPVRVTGGIKIGGVFNSSSSGTLISWSGRCTATLATDAIAAGTTVAQDIACTSAAVAAECVVGGPAGLEAGLIQSCVVTSAGHIGLRTANVTASPVTPAGSQTVSVRYFDP